MTKRNPHFIDTRGYETEYGVPQDTQDKMRARGEGPPWLKIGHKVFYPREQLQRYFDEQLAKAAAPPAGAPAPGPRLVQRAAVGDGGGGNA
jgi:hypothetical protein